LRLNYRMRLFILAVALLGYAAALGVMSVDLGSEWFKVSLSVYSNDYDQRYL
jgi:hypothetical protein